MVINSRTLGTFRTDVDVPYGPGMATDRGVETRQSMPDRLRGIALLGIVVVNVPYLALSTEGFTAASVQEPIDAVTAFLVYMFAQGKFYLLFSFLFGYSAAFILRDGSAANRRRFVYRLLALLTFGLAHAVFFFIGDILITYALLGFGLLLLSRRSDRALITWATVAIVFGVVFVTLVMALYATTTVADSQLLDLDAALASGSFLDAASARLAVLPSAVIFLLLVQGPMAFAAFLFGLLASRHRFLAEPPARELLWRRLMIIGLGIGLPLQGIAAWLQISALRAGDLYTTDGVLGLVLGYSTAPIVTAGLIGSVGWLLARRPKFLRFASPAGRASLSVYIGESVLLSLFFSGYGLGLFGDWGAFPVVLTGIAAWVVLSILAWLWLRRSSQGPLEFVLALASGRRRTRKLGV